MPSNKAFTLLELLVVITIIGILSSIVIVSMSGSTDSATIAKGKAYAQQVHALLGANAVGVWNFDEGEGTTLTDISGYGNDGSLIKGANGTGLDWVSSDVEGTALQFDGVDDYVDCGDDASLDINQAFTVETWINQNNTLYYPSFFSQMSGDYRENEIQFRLTNTNQIQLQRRPTEDSNTVSRETSDIQLSNNEWYHIVGTYNGLAMSIYLNGVLISSNSGTASFTSLEGKNNRIGVGILSGSFFDGLIDDVRIYSEALPSTEIQKHYVQGLEKLLSNQAIVQAEYDQRMEEFNQSLVRYEQ